MTKEEAKKVIDMIADCTEQPEEEAKLILVKDAKKIIDMIDDPIQITPGIAPDYPMMPTITYNSSEEEK